MSMCSMATDNLVPCVHHADVQDFEVVGTHTRLRWRPAAMAHLIRLDQVLTYAVEVRHETPGRFGQRKIAPVSISMARLEAAWWSR